MKKYALWSLGLWLIGASPCSGQAFVDEFDLGEITERWLVQRNAVGSTEIAQEDGHAVVTATGTNANDGLASVAAFDPLADGIYVSFVISEIVGAPNANGFLVGVVDDNTVFHRNTNNFGIAAFGQEPRTFSSDGFSLIVGDQNGSGEADIILDEGEAVDMASFQNGFMVILSADEAGWSYVIEGLADLDGVDRVYENTGTWADVGTTFQEIFGEDDQWHVLTANQSPGEKITRFDRITPGDPKPSSDPDIQVTSRLALGQRPSFPQVQEAVLSVRNAGETQDLNITGVEVSGPDAEHFGVPADQFPLVIAPDGRGDLRLEVDNLGETGGFLGVLTLLSDDPAPAEDARVAVEVTASVIDLQGPRAHYPFDEAEGTEMRDVTGFDRHGLYGEGVVLGVEGLAGGTAIAVSGGDSATVPGRHFEEGTFESFSVSLWFEASQVAEIGTLFANGLVGESPAFALLVAEGQLSWFVEEVVEFGAPSVFEIDPAAPFHIGAFGTLGFNGVIDELQLSQRVLTPEEVDALLNPSGEPPVQEPTDSDGDGLSDEDEVSVHGTDPLSEDPVVSGLQQNLWVKFRICSGNAGRRVPLPLDPRTAETTCFMG